MKIPNIHLTFSGVTGPIAKKLEGEKKRQESQGLVGKRVVGMGAEDGMTRRKGKGGHGCGRGKKSWPRVEEANPVRPDMTRDYRLGSFLANEAKLKTELFLQNRNSIL